MELNQEPLKRRRIVDTSNAEARRALAQTLSRFSAWRLDLARFDAIAQRPNATADREAMLRRCAQIAAEAMAARTTLILSLEDKPRRVAGHSRVVDAERALDNIDAAVRALQQKLLS